MLQIRSIKSDKLIMQNKVYSFYTIQQIFSSTSLYITKLHVNKLENSHFCTQKFDTVIHREFIV